MAEQMALMAHLAAGLLAVLSFYYARPGAPADEVYAAVAMQLVTAVALGIALAANTVNDATGWWPAFWDAVLMLATFGLCGWTWARALRMDGAR